MYPGIVKTLVNITSKSICPTFECFEFFCISTLILMGASSKKLYICTPVRWLIFLWTYVQHLTAVIKNKKHANLEIVSSLQWEAIFGFGFHDLCEWHHEWGRFLTIQAHVTWPTPNHYTYFTQAFIGNFARIQVYWAFDQFSSISGSKVMTQKQQNIIKLSDQH